MKIKKLSYNHPNNIFREILYISHMHLGWLDDKAEDAKHYPNTTLTIKTKDQADKALVLISLGLNKQEIEEILNEQ